MDYVYLIRLHQKLSNRAQYYIGYTPKTPLERLQIHRSGRGAKILAAANEANIEYNVVRVWENADRTFERTLKNTKNAKRFCPIANQNLKQHLYKHHNI